MLPNDYLKRCSKMLGDEYDAFLSSYDYEQAKSLRFNPLKTDDEQFPYSIVSANASVMEALEIKEPVPWEECAYYFSAAKPGKHPYHEAGVFYIQEPSAMVPVTILDVKPGDRVLDLCAAPGGKSTQIAGRMRGRGLLVCNEPYTQRAKILSENIERMGVRNAIVLNEYPDKLSSVFSDFFDKILVDAPCSGEGMFRKNDEAEDEWSIDNVKMCAMRQLDILNAAAGMLKSGGRLVYSTCTFSPEEDEGVIAKFLSSHPEFYLGDPGDVYDRFGFCRGSEKYLAMALPDKYAGECECAGEEYDGIFACDNEQNSETDKLKIKSEIEKTVRIWPHKVKGEGHFVALLCKKGNTAENFEGYVHGGYERGIPKKELKEFADFCRENLSIDFADIEKMLGHTGKIIPGSETECGVFVRFGDNLYLAPFKTPSLKGLKVMRAGLQLGAFMKNRFEPSHALAMALRINEVNAYVSLPSDGDLIKSYFGGLSISVDEIISPHDTEAPPKDKITLLSQTGSPKWVLMTVDGYSAGWAKYAGSMLKNHYPKGLRKV